MRLLNRDIIIALAVLTGKIKLKPLGKSKIIFCG